MRLIIDTDAQLLIQEEGDQRTETPLYSDESFVTLSHQWLKMGWNQKYTYAFSWLGRPIIQLPEDMVRIQELIHSLKPDVIVETGIAHGGSLIYYASLCHAMGHGRIIGVDIEIRPHNRAAIEAHPMFKHITLIEADSVAESTIDQVKSLITEDQTVLVILDSNHTREHVSKELLQYGPMVTKGSYIVVTDGFMKDLTDVPRGDASWDTDNPHQAVQDYLKDHPEFEYQQPEWPFNESTLKDNLTHWPMAYLKRV